jgi:hypothetical protein
VSAVAWVYGNPFNGTTFGVLALLLIVLAGRLSKLPVAVASATLLVPGVFLTGFGWIYPHFVNVNHWMSFTYAAPFGLLPCPTLSGLIGVTLVFDMFWSKPWSLALAVAGFVYGVIGVLELGVALDYGLLAGAMWLAAVAAATTTRPPQPAGVEASA